jgi:hypothetical protein
MVMAAGTVTALLCGVIIDHDPPRRPLTDHAPFRNAGEKTDDEAWALFRQIDLESREPIAFRQLIVAVRRTLWHIYIAC